MLRIMKCAEVFSCWWSPLQRWLGCRGQRAAEPTKQVTLPEYGVVAVAVSLNFLGVDCLRTNLLTKKAMGLAEPGDVLEIITDNPSSAETISFMLPNYGCTYLTTIHEERYRILYVKKVLGL